MLISDWSSDVCSSDLASATLSIPTMILGETALSFLGLGLRPPITSWGVLLTEAQNINAVALYPWVMTPVIPVVLVVLAFNFLGDGLRGAADPYRSRRERRRARGRSGEQGVGEGWARASRYRGGPET